ncbi:agmatinase [bacterium]|nr:agmatinase [bacterium]
MTAFLDSEFKPAKPTEAAFHVIPAPYEKSVSYGTGTKLGPKAIIESSSQLEKIQRGFAPGENGIYTAKPAPTLNAIEKAVSYALKCHSTPFLLGGEHTVTLPAIKALKAFYGPEIGLIQFDAHADLRFAYEDDPLSHASVMRRISELNIPIAQFGTRSYCQEEQDFRQDKKNKVTFHDAEELFRRFKERKKNKLLPANFPKKIYVSFDIDGLDSAIMPATGTPVPGGLLWYQTLDLLAELTKGRTIIGLDLVEFSPIKNFHAYDFTAATLAYEMMALV